MQPNAQAAQPEQPAQPAPPGAPATYTPNQPPALPPGTILLDRYLIQGYIGGGGFGHIYKVLDSALGYRRALKEAFYQDPATQRQFQLEAEFLLNARHPNLVRGYAVFEQMGRLYLVMDYVDGHTLEEIAIDHIRRTSKPLPEARLLDWVIPICGALHALHSCPVPVIHRDVKPANVKVNRSGIPILIDLGLAKLYARGTHTIGAALAFTPGYAPPEQYRATGATDARTDVYGMGATLFYLLTGYQPTEAPARLGSLVVPPLRQLCPTVSAATEAAVLRAMELAPAQRQQSAQELEIELRGARAALDSTRVLWGSSTPAAPTWPLLCARCGTANPPIARHCMRCAAFLDGSMIATDQPAADRMAADSPPVARMSADSEGADAVRHAQAAGEGAATGDDEAGASAQDGAVTTSDGEPAAPDVASVASADLASGEPSSGQPSGKAPAPEEVEAFSEMADQPAMALPRLRRGPAPAAVPLRRYSGASASDPAAAVKAAAGGEQVAHAASGQIIEQEPIDREASSAAAAAGEAGAHTDVDTSGRTPRARGGWQRVVPSLPRWHAETVAAAIPTTDAEVRSGVAALMALVLAVGTIGAAQLPGPLVLVVPALAAPALLLGHWSLHGKGAHPIPEVGWLATLALIITYAWLALFTLGRLILALHGLV